MAEPVMIPRIVRVLTLHRDLFVKPQYKNIGSHPLSGLCYVASEAYYHLEGKAFGYYPMRVRVNGIPHYYLENYAGHIIDITRPQFGDMRVPYKDGRRTGFLTKEPSKRARKLIQLLEHNS